MNRYRPDKHHRRSIRLPMYDYRTPGAYFVTICTFAGRCLFDDESLARIVRWSWRNLVTRSRSCRGDAFVVMPNHVHFILWIQGEALRAQHSVTRSESTHPGEAAVSYADADETCAAPLLWRGVRAGALGAIVRAFKSASAKRINELRGSPAVPVWQRNYYERIIRNDRDLEETRRYIVENPVKWADDPNNPANEAPP